MPHQTATPALNTASSPPAAANPLQGLLDRHNALRTTHFAPALVWNATIAATAQAWSTKCTFAHNTSSGFGENIYLSTGVLSQTNAVNLWYNEVWAAGGLQSRLSDSRAAGVHGLRPRRRAALFQGAPCGGVCAAPRARESTRKRSRESRPGQPCPQVTNGAYNYSVGPVAGKVTGHFTQVRCRACHRRGERAGSLPFQHRIAIAAAQAQRAGPAAQLHSRTRPAAGTLRLGLCRLPMQAGGLEGNHPAGLRAHRLPQRHRGDHDHGERKRGGVQVGGAARRTPAAARAAQHVAGCPGRLLAALAIATQHPPSHGPCRYLPRGNVIGGFIANVLRPAATTVAPSPPAAPAGSNPLQASLDRHNALRVRHKSAALAWNTTLANLSAAYAAKCLFAHDPANTLYGENIFASTGGTFNQSRAVEKWYNEVRPGGRGALPPAGAVWHAATPSAASVRAACAQVTVGAYNFATGTGTGVIGHFTQVRCCA
jgi:uncharacterized protein YkwD